MTEKPRKDLVVKLDPIVLRRHLAERGLSRSQLKDALEDVANNKHKANRDLTLSHNTIDKAFTEVGIRPDVAKTLADFFGCRVLELLSPKDEVYLTPTADSPRWEWEIEDLNLLSGRKAANGLISQFYVLRHRHTVGRMARGKFHLLSKMSAEEKIRKQGQLQRHPDVCHRIGPHPNLAEVISSSPTEGGDGWWVVERWEGAESVATRIEKKRWPESALPRLMREIAQGLLHLHHHAIVLRELAPSRILIRPDGSVVLTDFELAKLLDGSPTVMPNDSWPEDEYRAPEVGPGKVLPCADIYSWGRILVHAATGKLPAPGEDVDLLTKCSLPRAVWAIAKGCLELIPSKRPQSMEEILKAIVRWEPKGAS